MSVCRLLSLQGQGFVSVLKKVCVQLPTSAVNVALPAFAAVAPAMQQLVNTSYQPEPHTRRTLLQRANGTDRRTDTVPLHRPHTMRAAPRKHRSFLYDS